MSPLSGMLLLLLSTVMLMPQEGSAFDPLDSSFFKHYSIIKVMSECFGAEEVRSRYIWLEKAMIQCHDEVHKKMDDATVTRVERAAVKTDTTDTKVYRLSMVRHIKEEMLERIDFTNCVFDRMNLTLLPDSSVDVALMVKYYTDLKLNETLTNDLVKGAEKCAKLTTCSQEYSIGPLDANFQKKVKFIKCEKRCRLISCIKQDLRTHSDQFELEGLDGVLDDVKDDGSKMLAIAAAKAKLFDSYTFL